MRFSGLSKHYARQAIKRAEDWLDQWENIPKSPTDAPAEMHPVSNNGVDLHGQNGREYPKISQNLPSRARSLNTGTEQHSTDHDNMGETPRPPKPSVVKCKALKGHGTEQVQTLWEALNIQRKAYRPDSTGITLQQTWAATLRQQLTISTPGDIMRAYRYFSEGEGAKWYRDKELDLHAMMTRRTLERMMAESTDWSPEADEQAIIKRLAEGY